MNGLRMMFLVLFPLGVGAADLSHQLGVSIHLTASSQDDLNRWLANGAGQPGSSPMGPAYEVSFNYFYRFSNSMFALGFNPVYGIQSGKLGAYKAQMSSIQAFPKLLFVPLENEYFQLFFDVGVGIGRVDLQLEAPGAKGSYNATVFGVSGGVGAQFCFVESHCVVAGGQFRYMPVERLTGSAVGNLGGGITQANGELEMDNRDLQATLTGIVGYLGYRLRF